MQQLESIRLT